MSALASTILVFKESAEYFILFSTNGNQDRSMRPVTSNAELQKQRNLALCPLKLPQSLGTKKLMYYVDGH